VVINTTQADYQERDLPRENRQFGCVSNISRIFYSNTTGEKSGAFFFKLLLSFLRGAEDFFFRGMSNSLREMGM
jgi:hypothetical protein